MSSASSRASVSDFEYVMWLLGRRTDIGPVLCLIRLLHGTVEEHVARYALRRLVRDGKVASARKGRKTYYELKRSAGDAGVVALKVERQSERWNGRWYLLTYDLPKSAASARKLLIRAMRAAGMGMLNGSTWISPYDCSTLITGQAGGFGASDYLVWARDADLALPEDARNFARHIWQLDKLSERYKRVAKSRKQILNLDLSNGQGRRAAFRRAFRLFHEWAALQKDDPMLPEELLPHNWPAVAAARSIAAVRRRLSAFAREFLAPD